MTVAVSWQAEPDEEPLAEVVELPCPDVEHLHDPAELPPPALLLAADPVELPGQWVDAGMSAWFAHTNRTTLALARWMLETSRAQAGTRERVHGRRRAGKIVAASLGWSEAYAAQRIEFARQVLERLPALGEAMADGRLEERKAGLFTSALADLDTAQARTVVERVLPDAPRLPFGVLRARIEAAAEAVDSDWAAAWRAAAIARRRVTFRVAPSGAAELCGLDLPEEPAQDAHDRIVALARAVARRLRAAGADAPIGPIRSEVMLTLTGPDGAGMWDADVVEHVVSRFGDDSDGGADPDDPDDGPDDEGPDDEGPDDEGPDDEGPDDEGPDDEGPDGGPEDDRARDDEPDTDEPDDLGSRERPSQASGPDDAAREKQPTPWRVPFVPRVALRVGLATVLGLDRRPGHLPGRGPVTNQVAISMAWNRPHSTFRLLLYDPDGALDHVLTVRPPRNGPPPPHAAQRRHHVVELTAYTHELDAPTAALADPTRGELPGPTPRDALVPGDALTLLERAGRALKRARARPPEEHPARTEAEVGNRFPSAELRAWIQARDRTCRHVACTADAIGCDVDHTVAVVDDGRTEAGDLGPFCRRDHAFKHDPDSGWTVRQPRPGRFEWTSPTGRLHIKEPEPYDPLPDPVPRTDPDHHYLLGLTSEPPPPAPPPGSPRRNKHGFLTRAALDTAAHLRRRAREQPRPATETETETDPNPDERFPEEPPF
ncbi:HNH endonuclease signature motif containing protein [Actinomycetospora sp. TBRC 11914]|uniref:HNH endonuclease signature motif containing protein n=1 Tax=Actinomycetospora sp. TBRC 11914 TaxID=2729387 RepID=UPI00145D0EA6|nr:HNH endonuclease signature motif containing protein [Actinomycetospora sp. TBRC 11914]NMO91168.1 DUF222 domain-containing protein [Actinomycetospora sp. TBRC 11914]